MSPDSPEAGASAPDKSYPARLAVELEARFPAHPITVINRGVNGEEIGDMVKRFDSAVVAAKPDLVLWQLGTNSIIRDHRLSAHDRAIRDGLKKIRAVGADIVLIDPQFAPKVIAKPDATHMVELIAATAKREGVDLLLQQHAAQLRDAAQRSLRQLGAAEFDAADRRRTQAGQGMQQRGLAGAIAAEDGQAFADTDGEVEIAHHGAPAHRHREVGHAQHGAAHRGPPLGWRDSRKRNTGTPSRAVSTPTGSCCGATTVRARVSAMTSSEPPARAAAGSSTR